MKFTLPSQLSEEDLQELERATILGGPDSMPSPCHIHVDPTELRIAREVDESGNLALPWSVNNTGRVMLQSATLIENHKPYDLLLELARGKVNQLRNQASDWLLGGLNMPPSIAQQIRAASKAFCHAVARQPSDESRQLATNALTLACEASEQLVRVYTNQVFNVRQSRQDTLDTILACRMGPDLPNDHELKAVVKNFNGVSIPLSISSICPEEDEFDWQASDSLIDWACEEKMAFWGGPLVDFSQGNIPSWLYLWERDRNRIVKLLCDYASEVVRHYREDISTWHLTSAANIPGTLSLQDDELLWLTMRMAESVRKIDPKAQLVVGVAQPWGEYMAGIEQAYSPFVFVDTLLRSGLSLAAIDLEIIMGVNPRGSYCHDLLEVSRVLDIYALLGVPLQVTMGFPSSTNEDHLAHAEYQVGNGSWKEGYSQQLQADWVTDFVALALCKPFVRSVQWAQLSDAKSHQFPNVGLFDADGKAKPAIQRLGKLRSKYLK